MQFLKNLGGRLKRVVSNRKVQGVALIGTVAMVAVGGGVSGAVAAGVVQPSANTVGPTQIQTGGVWGGDVHDNTLAEPKLGADFRNKVNGTVKTANDAKAAAAKAQADATKALEQGGTPGKDGKDGLPGTNGKDGKDGVDGKNGTNGTDGKDGADSLLGAYYSVGFYDKGDTNEGAIATVGCKLETDTAISGGVQVIDPSKNTPVSSSFPGRMDWTTNTPKANRLDGWIVQFGGNAGAVADKAPLKVKIWALCVPKLVVPVVQTYTQSTDG